MNAQSDELSPPPSTSEHHAADPSVENRYGMNDDISSSSSRDSEEEVRKQDEFLVTTQQKLSREIAKAEHSTNDRLFRLFPDLMKDIFSSVPPSAAAPTTSSSQGKVQQQQQRYRGMSDPGDVRRGGGSASANNLYSRPSSGYYGGGYSQQSSDRKASAQSSRAPPATNQSELESREGLRPASGRYSSGTSPAASQHFPCCTISMRRKADAAHGATQSNSSRPVSCKKEKRTLSPEEIKKGYSTSRGRAGVSHSTSTRRAPRTNINNNNNGARDSNKNGSASHPPLASQDTQRRQLVHEELARWRSFAEKEKDHFQSMLQWAKKCMGQARYMFSSDQSLTAETHAEFVKEKVPILPPQRFRYRTSIACYVLDTIMRSMCGYEELWKELKEDIFGAIYAGYGSPSTSSSCPTSEPTTKHGDTTTTSPAGSTKRKGSSGRRRGGGSSSSREKATLKNAAEKAATANAASESESSETKQQTPSREVEMEGHGETEDEVKPADASDVNPSLSKEQPVQPEGEEEEEEEDEEEEESKPTLSDDFLALDLFKDQLAESQLRIAYLTEMLTKKSEAMQSITSFFGGNAKRQELRLMTLVFTHWRTFSYSVNERRSIFEKYFSHQRAKFIESNCFLRWRRYTLQQKCWMYAQQQEKAKENLERVTRSVTQRIESVRSEQAATIAQAKQDLQQEKNFREREFSALSYEVSTLSLKNEALESKIAECKAEKHGWHTLSQAAQRYTVRFAPPASTVLEHAEQLKAMVDTVGVDMFLESGGDTSGRGGGARRKRSMLADQQQQQQHLSSGPPSTSAAPSEEVTPACVELRLSSLSALRLKCRTLLLCWANHQLSGDRVDSVIISPSEDLADGELYLALCHSIQRLFHTAGSTTETGSSEPPVVITFVKGFKRVGGTQTYRSQLFLKFLQYVEDSLFRPIFPPLLSFCSNARELRKPARVFETGKDGWCFWLLASLMTAQALLPSCLELRARVKNCSSSALLYTIAWDREQLERIAKEKKQAISAPTATDDTNKDGQEGQENEGGDLVPKLTIDELEASGEGEENKEVWLSLEQGDGTIHQAQATPSASPRRNSKRPQGKRTVASGLPSPSQGRSPLVPTLPRKPRSFRKKPPSSSPSVSTTPQTAHMSHPRGGSGGHRGSKSSVPGPNNTLSNSGRSALGGTTSVQRTTSGISSDACHTNEGSTEEDENAGTPRDHHHQQQQLFGEDMGSWDADVPTSNHESSWGHHVIVDRQVPKKNRGGMSGGRGGALNSPHGQKRATGNRNLQAAVSPKGGKTFSPAVASFGKEEQISPRHLKAGEVQPDGGMAALLALHSSSSVVTSPEVTPQVMVQHPSPSTGQELPSGTGTGTGSAAHTTSTTSGDQGPSNQTLQQKSEREGEKAETVDDILQSIWEEFPSLRTKSTLWRTKRYVDQSESSKQQWLAVAHLIYVCAVRYGVFNDQEP